MSDVLKLLHGTRELLSDRKRWTKGAGARDGDGLKVDFDDASAVCWCVNGAVSITAERLGLGASADEEARIALRTTSLNTRGVHVVAFNDNRMTTHADILALLDRTIARLEERV